MTNSATILNAIANNFADDIGVTITEHSDKFFAMNSWDSEWQLSAKPTADGILIQSECTQTETTRIRIAKTAEEAVKMSGELWGIYFPF